jgi:transcription elongation factor Elf1
MGKRKSRTSKLMAEPKKAPKLDTDFTCPFCNHPGAVQCNIFLRARRLFSAAPCSVCKETYTKANALTEPIEVYSEWIDSCEEANEGVVVRRPRLGDATD